jgi:sialic acid synthase SpsE
MDIIAEAGLNHDGNLNKAIDMIRIAKESGANIVKFQYYLVDFLCAYRNDYSAYDLLKRLCPKPQWIPILADECERQGLEFLCTAFCRYSVEEIAQYVRRFKIASPEAANLDFVRHVAEYGKPLIISTGKIGDEQIRKILDAVTVPVTLLVCVSRYPALPSEYKLSEIKRLKKKFGVSVGVSCHCQGIKNALEAVNKGAEVIEKHFMLKNDTKCVDSAVSLEPDTFLKLTQIIRGKYGKRN